MTKFKNPVQDSHDFTWLRQLEKRLTLISEDPFRLTAWGPKKPLGPERIWLGLACQLYAQIYSQDDVDLIWKFEDAHPKSLPWTLSMYPGGVNSSVKSELLTSMIPVINSLAEFDPNYELNELRILIHSTNPEISMLPAQSLLYLKLKIERLEVKMQCQGKAWCLFDAICTSHLQQGIEALKVHDNELGPERRIFQTKYSFHHAMNRPCKMTYDPWWGQRDFIEKAFSYARKEYKPDLACQLYRSFPRRDVKDWIIGRIGYFPAMPEKGGLSVTTTLGDLTLTKV